MANENRGYEIWVFDLNGKLIRKIRKEYAEIPVSEHYRTKILNPMPEFMRAVAFFPEFHTPFQSIVAGEEGKMRTKFNSIVILILLMMMVSSCSQNGTEWQGTIKDVDDVTYVRNPEEGQWDLNGEANVTIIEERQIGELDGPEEFLFAFIADIAVNSKGDIYVSDRRLNEVKRYNKDGEYLMNVGRFGQGPGEFQSPTVLSVNIRDELIVSDNKYNYTVFRKITIEPKSDSKSTALSAGPRGRTDF